MLSLISISGAFAATLVITPPSTSSAQCPLVGIDYFVTVPSGGLPNCTYNWTVTGGSFVNGISTGTSVKVIWNDATGTGTLKVTASACNPSSENGSTVTNTYTRLSVFGKSFLGPPNATCPNTIDVPFCSTNAIIVCADKMFVQNTGAIGEPPQKEVDRYIFSIPTGWKEAGTNNVGPINVSTVFNFISLEPLSASGGTVTVVGSITNTCNAIGVSNSNAKTITITRSPALVITPPAGYLGPRCGLVAPVTFSVNVLPCANTYTWTKPAGWAGTSTTNSITLTPDGATGGTLTVNIGLSTGATATKTFALTFFDNISNPTLTKSSSQSEICAGESWTFTCVPPTNYPTDYGFDWYATGGLLINGVSTSITSPLHTGTNVVTVSANSGSFGTSYIYTRVNNNVCTPSNYVYLETQVGPFSSSQFAISGTSTACPNTTVSYLPTYIDPSITNYQWSWSGFVSASGQGTPYLSATTGTNFNSGTITLRLGNRCGLTGSPAMKIVYKPYCSGGYSFAVSPNPSSSLLSVSMVDETSGNKLAVEELPTQADETSVLLVNNKSIVVASGKLKSGQLDLDISGLPNGLYVARILAEGKVVTKQILIKH
ncbi:MAG: hypothetical protein JNM78_14790 [Cyclobacteriaceae bacterium]|nr:hypothetical protein [Cyclobacteriaceae bacterium]